MPNRFWIGGTGTWDASDTSHWSATTGPGTSGASVPGPSDVATFDANSGGGTVTVNTTVAIQTLIMSAFTGILTFATNNNNVTLSVGFTSNGTGTRTLNMGNGTWTLSGATGTVWDVTVSTNFTLNANGSTIVFSGNVAAVVTLALGAGLSYNAITFNAASNKGTFAITVPSTTMGAVTIAAPNNFTFAGNLTFPISSITVTGGSISNMVGIASSTANQSATLSDTAGTNTLDWTVLRRITGSGGATFNAANSIDLGQNSGITITNPTVGGGGGGSGVIGG